MSVGEIFLSWLKRIFIRNEKEVQVTFCGLDAAGKTSILEYLVSGEIAETVPTTGVSSERIRLKGNTVFEIYDLPVQKSLHNLLNNYLIKTHLIVFVLDAADTKRLQEAKDLFWEVYSHEANPHTPVCIIANKQDLIESINIEQIKTSFKLNRLSKDCKYNVFGTSATTGLGIVEAFQWIYETLTGKKIHMKITVDDLIIFDRTGLPVASKRKLLGESTLADGLLSALQSFANSIDESNSLDTVVMSNHRICFTHAKNYSLAIVMNADDEERIGKAILTSLSEKITQNDFLKPNDILNNFIISDLRTFL